MVVKLSLQTERHPDEVLEVSLKLRGATPAVLLRKTKQQGKSKDLN